MLHEGVTGAQVDGIRRGELDLGLARPPFDTSPSPHRWCPRAAARGRARPTTRWPRSTGRSARRTSTGVPVISYHPVQARYFHELTVRFLANAAPEGRAARAADPHRGAPRSAREGVALVPASAAALGVAGVRYKALTDLGGGHPESDPSRPVELHAMWVRGGMTPMLRQVLRLVRRSAEHVDEIVDAQTG